MSSLPNTSVTLQDVANAAGVSVSTASRALNGRAKEFRIAQLTVDRVRATARKMAFQPSRVAQSLRSQRSGLIGIVVPDISNPFFASIARVITLSAETRGYHVLLADSQESTEREVELIDRLRQQQIEALIVCPVGIESHHLQVIHESMLPIVLVDRVFPELDIHQVSSQQAVGAEQLAKLLYDHGHRSIGVLQGLPGTYPNQTRLKALRKSLQVLGVKLRDDHVVGDSFTEVSGYQATLGLMSKFPKITALVALSTPNAFGALKAIREGGKRVPEDLSMATFDDSPFADFMQVPFSTVRQYEQELGRVAIEILFKQLDLTTSKKLTPKLHELPCQLVERSSVLKV